MSNYYSNNTPLYVSVDCIIFGFLILLHPSIGAIAITIIIGGYFVAYGALGIAEYIHSKKK